MCGIAGFQLRQGDGDPRLLAQALLNELVVRGRDASGIAYHRDDADETFIQKFACAGNELAPYLDETIGRTAILHTRYATQGSPANNDNNHPIDVNGVVGVHNGHVNNDDTLFKRVQGYKRKGRVDSEAIFAYLRYGPKGRQLTQKLSDIRGGAAIMWLQTNSPKRYLHIARLSSSPLCFAHTEGGSVIAASTQDILQKAAGKAGFKLREIRSLDEGVYVRFQNSEITRTLDIPMPKPTFTFSTPRTEVANTRATQLRLDVGSHLSGEYRDGRWVTGLDVLLEQWEREAREDN